MPGFNQTGPMGQGPMTGRRMGRCTNFGSAGKQAVTTASEENIQKQAENLSGTDAGFGWRRGGRGRGKRAGRGLGMRNRYRREI